MKWIFARLTGIHCLYVGKQPQPIMLNINEIQQKAIRLLSPNTRKYYNLQ